MAAYYCINGRWYSLCCSCRRMLVTNVGGTEIIIIIIITIENVFT